MQTGVDLVERTQKEPAKGVETPWKPHLDRAMPTRILSEAATAARMAARSDARVAHRRLARGIGQLCLEVGPAWAAGAASLLTQGN